RHREKRHGFSKTVYGRAPLLAQHQQDRGYQRAGVTDADPPNEVEDVHAPGYRLIHSPKTDAHKKQLRDRQQQQLEKDERDRKTDKPPDRRASLQHDRTNLVRYGCKRQPRSDYRRRRVVYRTLVVWLVRHFVSTTCDSGSVSSCQYHLR